MMEIFEIPGLYLINNFINEEEESEILNQLEKNKWSGNGVAYYFITSTVSDL